MEKQIISQEVKDKIALRNSSLKIFVIVTVILVISIRLITNPIAVTPIDFKFSDFLSLILAIFSIALSVAFYFKATDTSNEFYNNTYQFTKEISEILGRIEAGFGERLRHLDEGYSGLRDRFDKLPFDEQKAEKEIKKEEAELKKKEEERNQLILNLANRAKLSQEESGTLLQKLKQTDAELSSAKAELNYLKRQLERSVISSETPKTPRSKAGLLRYIRSTVIPLLGIDIVDAPRSLIVRKFSDITEKLHPDFLKDIKEMGWLDENNQLTIDGARSLRSSYRERSHDTPPDPVF